MYIKVVPILVFAITFSSLAMAGISSNIPYVLASQDGPYKNQGQCMKEQREDDIDKETYKQTCKAIDFNDDGDCVDSDEVLCDDGGDGGDGEGGDGGDGEGGDGSGGDDVDSGSNEDNQGCQENSDTSNCQQGPQ